MKTGKKPGFGPDSKPGFVSRFEFSVFSRFCPKTGFWAQKPGFDGTRKKPGFAPKPGFWTQKPGFDGTRKKPGFVAKPGFGAQKPGFDGTLKKTGLAPKPGLGPNPGPLTRVLRHPGRYPAAASRLGRFLCTCANYRQRPLRDKSGSQIAGQRQDGKPTTHQPPRESESRQTDRQNRQQPPHRSDTSAGESPTQRYAVVRGPVRCPPIRHLVVRVRVRVRPLCPPKRPHGPGKHQPGLQCAQT